MKTGAKTQEILKMAIRKITPKKKHAEKQLEFANRLIEKINSMKGPHIGAELVGSVARNTHLAGDNDIDIFVFYSPETPREKFEKLGLDTGKQVFRGHKWELAYSEHPYVRGEISGYEVEIVPTYRVEDPSMLKSAVDRSPFHNEYLKGKLNPELCAEVRLLKQFMKGVKCYGADLSMNSFPGYVAELLAVKYGGFLETMKAAAMWKKNEVIDLEGEYSEGEAVKKFGGTHFIIIDPVDMNRNVAAALSQQQYARFISACRAFLENPSYNFFFPKPHKPMPKKKLVEFLEKTELAAIRFKYPKGIVEDQMWGQLKRLSRKIAAMAKEEEFTVKRSGEWLEKGKTMVVLLELESKRLQRARPRVGPEVFDADNSKAFLEAHKNPFSGPRIENLRWVVETERKHVHIDDFLHALITRLKKQEKEDIRKSLRSGAKIIGEREIAKLYRKNKGFGQFLTEFLKGKEEFLEY